MDYLAIWGVLAQGPIIPQSFLPVCDSGQEGTCTATGTPTLPVRQPLNLSGKSFINFKLRDQFHLN